MEKINEVGYYEGIEVKVLGNKHHSYLTRFNDDDAGWYFWDHRGIKMGTWDIPMGMPFESKEDAEKGLEISMRLQRKKD